MRCDQLLWIMAFAASVAHSPARAQQQRYDLGRTPTAAEIAGWNVDVRADGQGLPAGSSGVDQGRIVYAGHCAMCHGDKGQGTPAPSLVGGLGTLATAHPVQTVGSYWPYATTLFDYIRRAMPFDAPGSLTADQVYAVTAYLLWLNGIVPQQSVLNANTLPKVIMPNRNGFISPDPRPDVP